MLPSIIISLEKACFVACPGCYNHFGKGVLSTQVLLAALATFREVGFTRLTLAGGDPLARDDVITVIRRLKSFGFWIALDTVGTPLLYDAATLFNGRKHVKKIDAGLLCSLIDRIGIPIDGTTQEVISTFRRGRERLSSEQAAIVKLLNESSIPIQVHTVVTRLNMANVPAIARVISRYFNVKEWELFQYMPSGPLGYRNRDVYSISRDQFEHCIAAAQAELDGSKSEARLIAKSISAREGAYILIDSDGVIWRPISTSDNDRCASEREIIADLREITSSDLALRLSHQIVDRKG